MINKKRGYKSSRKAKGVEEGTLIDGMDIARELYNNNLTPGELCLQLLDAGKKFLPDFYRSDLQNELDRIWEKQKEYYPEILTDVLKEELRGKNVMLFGLFVPNISFGKKTIRNGTKRKAKQNNKKENISWKVFIVNGKGMKRKERICNGG